MANTFIFECPFCGQRMECDDDMDGMTVDCPQCKQEIVPSREVPEPSEIKKQAGDQTKSRKNTATGAEKVVRSVSGALHSLQVGCSAADEVISSKTRGWSLKKRILGYADRDGSFKNPLLSVIFYYAGIGFFVIAVIIAVIRLCLDIAESRVTYHPEVYIVAAVFFADAVFNFGIAQIIYCIGRTAYNSDRIVELLADHQKK